MRRLVAANIRGGAALLLCATLAARIGGAQQTVTPAKAPPKSPAGGIWKAAVPLRPMRGEFDANDPIGVAAGARIKADCSLNWIDPDDGRRYCFASGTSLEMFLQMPHTNIERARASWRKLTPHGS